MHHLRCYRIFSSAFVPFKQPTAFFLLFISVFLSGMSLANDAEPLSPAEQAAQAHVDAVSGTTLESLMTLCHHMILYGSDAEKSNMLSIVGDQTCEQYINSLETDSAAAQ